MARGMSRTSAGAVDGLEHLRQSITDILTTRIGTRVMRRDYGSEVPNLIDAPANAALPVDFYVAVAEALGKWEPRLKLREAKMTLVGEGVIEFAFAGIYLPDGKEISLEGIVVR